MKVEPRNRASSEAVLDPSAAWPAKGARGEGRRLPLAMQVSTSLKPKASKIGELAHRDGVTTADVDGAKKAMTDPADYAATLGVRPIRRFRSELRSNLTSAPGDIERLQPCGPYVVLIAAGGSPALDVAPTPRSS